VLDIIVPRILPRQLKSPALVVRIAKPNQLLLLLVQLKHIVLRYQLFLLDVLLDIFVLLVLCFLPIVQADLIVQPMCQQQLIAMVDFIVMSIRHLKHPV